MLMSIVSIIANAAYIMILNLPLYTDRAHMPDGRIREWRRSPVTRLAIGDQRWLYSLQLILTAVSVISSVAVIAGVKSGTVRWIQIICLIISTAMFVIVMIVTNNIHAKY